MILCIKLTTYMLFVFVFISAFLIGYLAGSKGLNSGISQNLKLEIENLAQKTLEQNNQNFLHLAQNQFGNLQALALKDFESEKKQVKSIIENIEKSLIHHQRFVSEVEKNNLDQLSGLKENLNHLMQTEKELKQTTKSLESALKSNQSSGAFGEMQLQKLIEMAGLKKYIDFDTQAHLTLEEKTLRPDMILNLPHNRALVIDSKTPMSNYLKSVEESNAELKMKHIKTFVSDFKKHIADLSKKQYTKALSNSAPFIIMFVPNDNLYITAFENAPDLLDYAISNKVVIATPSNLLAMLLLIEKSWQDQNLSKKINQHFEEGRKLIEKLSIFVTHIKDLGAGLNNASKAYNKLQGSFDRTVSPQIKRFQKLRDENPNKSTLELPNINELNQFNS